MRHRLGTDQPGDLDHGDGLLGAFSRDAEGIDLAPEHVALDEVPDEPVEDGGAGIDLVMLHRPDGGGLAAHGGEVGRAGAAGIHVDGVDGVSLLAESGHAVGGVEPAGEGEGNCQVLHNA